MNYSLWIPGFQAGSGAPIGVTTSDSGDTSPLEEVSVSFQAGIAGEGTVLVPLAVSADGSGASFVFPRSAFSSVFMMVAWLPHERHEMSKKDAVAITRRDRIMMDILYIYAYENHSISIFFWIPKEKDEKILTICFLLYWERFKLSTFSSNVNTFCLLFGKYPYPIWAIFIFYLSTLCHVVKITKRTSLLVVKEEREDVMEGE